MKKREWFIVFLPLILTWYADRITKLWATELTGAKSFTILHFALHHNAGAMLGLFSDLPPLLRVVSLSTGGAVLVCIYALIQYLLPIRSLMLRVGLSILLGGILGNVTDRIVWGYIVDFIIVGNQLIATPAFNLADALQWIGYALIVAGIIRDGELLWPEYDTRRKYWVNPGFQIKYSLVLSAAGLGISLIAMVFCYTYLRVAILDLVGNRQLILDKFLMPFIMIFILISIAFSIGLFAVGRVISHKIAGPVFAFEKFVDDLIAAQEHGGTVRDFKLRSKDEFRHLEELAKKLKEKFEPRP